MGEWHEIGGGADFFDSKKKKKSLIWFRRWRVAL